MIKNLNELYKKSYLPLLVVVFLLILTAVTQFINGAELALFQPDYPITRDFGPGDAFFGSELDENHPYGGLHKCHYYGSCFSMINPVNLNFHKDITVLALFLLAVVAGMRELGRDRIVTMSFVLVSYYLFGWLHSLGWFYECTDFCGFEYLFLWIPLIGVFLVTIFLKKV